MALSPRGRVMTAVAAAIVASTPLVSQAVARASGASTISGTVFDDANRNGVLDPGETGFAGEQLYLFDASGNYVAATGTDANGNYQFTGLADGSYTLEINGTSWGPLQGSWVPTTTGSLQPYQAVSLAGSATADLGLRSIVRSTSLSSPITTATGSNGLVVNSYDDVLSAQTILNDLMTGSLLGPVAPLTTVYFDSSTPMTDTSVSFAGSQACSYGTPYTASLWIGYLSWPSSYDDVLWHEYGHAWGDYYTYIVQQDPGYTAYLKARGLYGNPMVGSSKSWDPNEMLAEDYRQLFGSPTAASYPQANSQIPPASQVPGLKAYLQSTYTTAPAGLCSSSGTSGGPSGGSSGGSSSTTTTTTAPTPSVAISGLGMSPQPVGRSGSVSFSVSLRSSVTVQILASSGALVKTLLSKSSEPAGSVSALWNRTNAAGKRVGSGTYRASVTATDAYGNTVTSAVSFSVS